MRKMIRKISVVACGTILAASIMTCSTVGYATTHTTVSSPDSSPMPAAEPVQRFKMSDEVPFGPSLQMVLQQLCWDNAVPYEIALAVIHQESRFDPSVQNGNCIGYMQVNDVNFEWLHREIGITDLHDPVQNLMAGTYMLGELFEKYGEWNMALTAYNFGEVGAREKFFKKGRISCPYSDSVIAQYKEWKKILEVSK